MAISWLFIYLLNHNLKELIVVPTILWQYVEDIYITIHTHTHTDVWWRHKSALRHFKLWTIGLLSPSSLCAGLWRLSLGDLPTPELNVATHLGPQLQLDAAERAVAQPANPLLCIKPSASWSLYITESCRFVLRLRPRSGRGCLGIRVDLVCAGDLSG